MSEVIEQRAGWPINFWCDAVGFSRSFYYKLPSDSRPRLVSLRGKILVVEAPAEWLERMVDVGGVVTDRGPAQSKNLDDPRVARAVEAARASVAARAAKGRRKFTKKRRTATGK